jgi:seryl-tRNA synthetase
VDSGVEGIYGRSGVYEAIAGSLSALFTRSGADHQATPVHFPPVIPRSVFEKTDYLKSFPDLTGSIHTFSGDDRQHAELLRLLEDDQDWTSVLEPAPIVLRPAACHPIYPMCTGRLPVDGRTFEIHGWCFRHEPSPDPARMQAFRMHEYVYLGTPEGAVAHRDEWIERGLSVLGGLDLAVEAVVANDPFFGRAGRMLATNQREETLKYEIVSPICSTEKPTAIMSSNLHKDHFSVPFGIESAEGELAHTSCIGFGVDRITLALLHTHGLDPGGWPAAVRAQLWP